jgi:hypothetical protein
MSSDRALLVEAWVDFNGTIVVVTDGDSTGTSVSAGVDSGMGVVGVESAVAEEEVLVDELLVVELLVVVNA